MQLFEYFIAACPFALNKNDGTEEIKTLALVIRCIISTSENRVYYNEPVKGPQGSAKVPV